MSDVLAAMRQRRLLSLVLADAACWLLGFLAFGFVRYTLTGVGLADALHTTPWLSLFGFALAATALHVAIAGTFRLQHGRHEVATSEDTLSLLSVGAVVGLVLTAGNLLLDRAIPGTVPLVAAAFALVLMVWVRALYRALAEDYWHRPEHTVPVEEQCRVLVMGAGDAGRQLVASMLRDAEQRYLPVALLDDDPALRHRRIRGIPVIGGREAVGRAAYGYEADVLVIAIPSAKSDLVREISEYALNVGLEVKVLPGTDELLSPGAAQVADIRDLDVTDLLGRHQIDTDIASIAGYLTDKRVLVTGAGGSIGSELCRQIAKFNPAQLIMLDRDESALHAVQLSIYGKALLDTPDVVLGDIRDNLFIDALFEERKPHVVFHAAALKHLPMLQQYPGEAIKTNVWGTLSILEAARAHGVERFVNISTDKAANPCSVLGYSKRLAEGLTAAVAQTAEGTYLSVRFGNVLGSRGSVLTAFTKQIEQGGPVTVTDPGVTRYFMTVQEAVQLVIQAAAIGRDGEALVLDMGKPVSIDAVARQLIELSGKDVEIIYTGLRPGEKLHEELWGDRELDLRPVHPLVSHTPVPPFEALEARELDPWAPSSTVVEDFVDAADKLAARVPLASDLRTPTGESSELELPILEHAQGSAPR
jgi:FlaA1/EpsC-like NDP-sugar epimerase